MLADDTEQRLIVLPPRLVVRCVTAEPERALAFHYFWAHPDGAAAEPAAAANFLLAALSYAYLTASPPFNCSADPFGSGKQHCRKTPAIGGRCAAENADAEQLVQNMRDGVFVPIALRLPAIEPRFAQLIDDGLSVMQKKKSMEKQAIPVFTQLCTYRDEAAPFFSAAGQDPLPQTGQTATGDRAAGSSVLAMQSFIERKGREVRRRRFFIRYRGGLIAAAAFIFGIIGIAAAITVQLRQPPETAGLSAEQVVQGFYAAIGDLDQAKMSAYTKNKAGAEYDGLLLHLFVTSKMREAYEQKKIYYSPEEFLLYPLLLQDNQAFSMYHFTTGYRFFRRRKRKSSSIALKRKQRGGTFSPYRCSATMTEFALRRLKEAFLSILLSRLNVPSLPNQAMTFLQPTFYRRHNSLHI